jgi:hypothetical protein
MPQQVGLGGLVDSSESDTQKKLVARTSETSPARLVIWSIWFLWFI